MSGKSHNARVHQPSKADLVKLYRQALGQNVALGELDQTVQKWRQRAEITHTQEATTEATTKKNLLASIPWFVRWGALLVPVSLVAIGLFLVGNAVIPIGSYAITQFATNSWTALTSPVPSDDVLAFNPVVVAEASGISIQSDRQTQQIRQAPTIIDQQLDYTNLANWFTAPDQTQALVTNGDPTQAGTAQQPATYIIDIPKLDIQRAEVVMGGTDLNNSLIQYPGTADPGDPGSPVIFGHSVLRQFYNPSLNNPRRYVSIFSTIMTLQTGDEIYLTYDGKRYKYEVETKKEVKPEDVYILTQNYDAQRVKLVTCTPEGTYLRRGVVTAKLVTS